MQNYSNEKPITTPFFSPPIGQEEGPFLSEISPRHERCRKAAIAILDITLGEPKSPNAHHFEADIERIASALDALFSES